MKKILPTFVRAIISIVFIILAVKLINFKDQKVAILNGNTKVIKTMTEEGEFYEINFIDNTSAKIKKDTVKIQINPGFLSLYKMVDKRLLLVAPSLLIAAIFLVALRWFLILKTCGYKMKLLPAFFITYIGQFFNNFLPGAVGGDVTRIAVSTKTLKDPVVSAGTVIIDRLIALGALLMLAFSVALLNLYKHELAMPLAIVCISFLIFFVLYFAYFSESLRKTALVQKIKESMPQAFLGLDHVFKTVNQKPGLVLKLIIISLVGQCVVICTVYLFARSIGIEKVELTYFFLFVPIGFVITSLPVSIGGWGVQEYTFAFLFATVGVAANQAIGLSLLFKLATIFTSLPGAIFFALGFFTAKDAKT